MALNKQILKLWTIVRFAYLLALVSNSKKKISTKKSTYDRLYSWSRDRDRSRQIFFRHSRNRDRDRLIFFTTLQVWTKTLHSSKYNYFLKLWHQKQILLICVAPKGKAMAPYMPCWWAIRPQKLFLKRIRPQIWQH